jgi:hypothetical protein
VQYHITSVTDGSQTLDCDDGGEVQMIADVIGTSGAGTQGYRKIGPMGDTVYDTKAVVGTEGRWLMSYNNGPVQEWKPSSMTIDDVDDVATFVATFEDQFGNIMVMPHPATGGSITVSTV